MPVEQIEKALSPTHWIIRRNRGEDKSATGVSLVDGANFWLEFAEEEGFICVYASSKKAVDSLITDITDALHQFADKS